MSDQQQDSSAYLNPAMCDNITEYGDLFHFLHDDIGQPNYSVSSELMEKEETGGSSSMFENLDGFTLLDQVFDQSWDQSHVDYERANNNNEGCHSTESSHSASKVLLEESSRNIVSNSSEDSSNSKSIKLRKISLVKKPLRERPPVVKKNRTVVPVIANSVDMMPKIVLPGPLVNHSNIKLLVRPIEQVKVLDNQLNVYNKENNTGANFSNLSNQMHNQVNVMNPAQAINSVQTFIPMSSVNPVQNPFEMVNSQQIQNIIDKNRVFPRMSGLKLKLVPIKDVPISLQEPMNQGQPIVIENLNFELQKQIRAVPVNTTLKRPNNYDSAINSNMEFDESLPKHIKLSPVSYANNYSTYPGSQAKQQPTTTTRKIVMTREDKIRLVVTQEDILNFMTRPLDVRKEQ